jgi:enoyl-CoA hydratase
MEYKNILVEVKDGIGFLTINRPKVLNALNPETLKEIECAIYGFAADRAVGAVIITGAGEKSFIAGADISEFPKMGVVQAREFCDLGHRVAFMLGELPKPVIAAVNGFALGGGTEMALACDFIVASENAKFGLPEVKLGIMPGFGGTQRLPRVVGMNIARELVFSGEMIDAARAREIGLANYVAPAAELMNKAVSLAKTIMARGPFAVAQAKRSVNRGADLALYDALELEKQCFTTLFVSSDAKEGATAFLEKRAPNFRGE